jgi:hypothetical protein
MINRALTHRLRKISQYLLVVTLAALVGPTVAPVWSGATFHNIPGAACAAFNTSQADMLERSHVRIYNPPKNSQSLWVVCPIVRVAEDVFATTNPVSGAIRVYFDALSAPTADVNCVIREFRANTTHVPGGAATLILNSVAVNIARPQQVPQVPDAPFGTWQFNYNHNFSFTYWTVVCKLAPGTGINTIDVGQQ